jgi:hypothetical protein
MEHLDIKPEFPPEITESFENEEENEKIYKWLSVAILLIWIFSLFLF